MRILLTGSTGQLGLALRASLPATLCGEPIELIPTARHPESAQGLVKLDLADPDACRSAVFIYQPDWVLNAGAYTAVDRAETDRELAHKVNAEAPRAFAESLASINRALVCCRSVPTSYSVADRAIPTGLKIPSIHRTVTAQARPKASER